MFIIDAQSATIENVTCKNDIILNTTFNNGTNGFSKVFGIKSNGALKILSTKIKTFGIIDNGIC